MGITELILVFSTTINLILFVLVFMMFITMNSMNIHINQMYNAMSTTVTKLIQQETLIRQIGNTLADFMDQVGIGLDQITTIIAQLGASGKMGQLFRTMDGKYTAGSLEELMEKIKEDDKDGEYFSDNMDDLRKLFESDEDEDEDDLDNEE